ncbi:MAG: Kelch repeat-containing protein [Planctomyces sp.]|jgi:N-acetylneuraminic acid mutarotase
MVRRQSVVLWCTIAAMMFITDRVRVHAQDQVEGVAAFCDLPQGIASFGAARLGESVYVYSGHVGRTHVYSLDAMSKGFYRCSLNQGGAWECLPMARPAQGVSLVATDRFLYRIGGMQAVNEPEEPHDLLSLSEVQEFDPNSETWRRMPDLPEPRSSHRAAILGQHIFVFGGWSLYGGEDGIWLKHGLVLDLGNESAGWKTVVQPVARRAVEVIAFRGRIWLIGGLTPDDDISSQIHVFDPVTETWSTGPGVPGMPANGNGIAAAVVRGALVLAGMDGRVYRLSENQSAWLDAGKLPSARIHHRLIGDENHLIVIAGATRKGHLKSAEFVKLDPWNSGDE